MQILVDADSCPRQVRELILRSSKRTKIPVIFAANRPIPGIEEQSMEICPPQDGSADNRIVELANAGDLVVTRDIPLAERLVDAGIRVLDDRGRVYTEDNIRYCRSLRDFSVGLVENGLGMVRTANYGKKELKAFADSFDRELTKLSNVTTTPGIGSGFA
jgi:uncharacterized protein YaiI (UPF0178 family)